MFANNGPSTSTSTSIPEDPYRSVHPSRINLKTTSEEKATRVYRKEQRRFQREQDRISRANGYAVSPPPSRRATHGNKEESMTPPRNPPKRPQPVVIDVDEDIEEVGYRWMGSRGPAARDELDRQEQNERINWLAQEELRGDPFSHFHSGFPHFPQPAPDLRIPKRFRPSSPARPNSRRDAAAELPRGIPPLGAMTEEEYASFVREGMYQRKHREEVDEARRRQRLKEEKEREREAERESARKREKQAMERLKAEKGKEEEKRLKVQRDRYRVRWKALGEIGGEIEETGLEFGDISWPVYVPHGQGQRGRKVKVDDLGLARVKAFLWALAGDEPGGDTRKVLREAIRVFHPDRFFSRVLGRVRDSEREMVKEGVERCSRLINELAAENRA